MELRQYVRIILRWWWLILLPPLIIGAYGLTTYRPAPAGYTASLRFTAGQPQTLTTSPGYDANYYRWLTSEYIVGGLKDWARTGAFAEAVSQELAASGTTIPASAIQGAIASDNARSVLVIYLTWGDREQLLALAQSATKVLQAQNADVFPQLGGQSAAVVPLDSPNPTPVGSSLRARLDLPLKVGLGFVVGLALAFLAHYFDPFVREKEELERLGLRVIAELPKARRKTNDE
jgi:capsular polysaccharide biosynthesis protein